MRVMPQKQVPSAFFWIAATLLVSVLCAALFVAVTFTQRSNLAQQQLRHDIVLRGADAVGLSFNTALKREWDSLQAVARSVSKASKPEIDNFMDAVVQTGGQVAWAGFADLSGTIVSGSNRLREGEDVNDRRWFREGLRQPNVGNVHDSRSLDANDNAQQLLNLSVPVFDQETGEVKGVAIYSLRMAWVNAFLTRSREQLNIDLIVQNRDGETIVDTRDTVRELPEAAAVLAKLGRDMPGRFQLLDQADGIYAFSPNFVSDEMPDFGWHVFAVLDSTNMTSVLPQLKQSAAIAVSIAAMVVLAATLIVARVVLRPLEDLVTTATEMAEANFNFPRESRSSREAVDLSRALARIQASLTIRQQPVAERPRKLRLLETARM